MKLFKSFIITSILLSLVVMTACNDSEAAGEDKEPIVFADAGWDSLLFHNEIASIIIEAGYDYETEQMTGSSSAVWTGISEGSIDVHMEVWKDNLAEIYEPGIENGEFEAVSLNFDDNYQGFYVPTYVIEGDEERGIDPVAPDLKYVSDLPDYYELFEDPEDSSKGQIIGAIPGWTVDEILHDAYEHYGLDETFNYTRPGSEAAINTSLSAAYDAGEPWVGYNYEPNWIMGQYDMTPIVEEEEGPLESIATQDIEIVVTSDLPDRAPEVTEFLSSYQTNSEIANDALVYIQNESASAHDAAVKFLEEHEDMWTEWVSDEVADKVREEIQ
ncbi:glycine betaine ABC transporter substrate-binding protein [Halalkalibacillus halophilus]|uniref:glycine betaine ABC transporter substrate-binding protein n=1 Tax=Halalkalibacillus halophilus TaxID=392827 RepID=UPI0003FE296D|nr:glycine betaine ABC transporter substrate-binding protein [Halalkalibacillus halophilus]